MAAAGEQGAPASLCALPSSGELGLEMGVLCLTASTPALNELRFSFISVPALGDVTQASQCQDGLILFENT